MRVFATPSRVALWRLRRCRLYRPLVALRHLLITLPVPRCARLARRMQLDHAAGNALGELNIAITA
ncbi:hypothetical protein, partial [Burkholderia sp. Bp8998]|uniref:hypothetical protein n=1 Tax=Burkholderia sp. Bp8998 TaxID=2184557 RepID=UPI001C8925E9